MCADLYKFYCLHITTDAKAGSSHFLKIPFVHIQRSFTIIYLRQCYYSVGDLSDVNTSSCLQSSFVSVVKSW